MIKPGYSLAVVAPPREILTNQGLVAPSRGTKNKGLVEPLTADSSPHLPLLPPSPPSPLPEPGGWRPAIKLDSELNRILIPPPPATVPSSSKEFDYLARVKPIIYKISSVYYHFQTIMK